MAPDGGPARGLDDESSAWLHALAATGPERAAAHARLHDLLLRVALREVRRRADRTPVGGPELTDVAHQAAADAMVALLSKVDTFRGESRFTTWAYRFVILEVSNKLNRHHWRAPRAWIGDEEWARLPDRLGAGPADRAEAAEMVAAVRAAVEEALTEHQRQVFVAVVVEGVHGDALAARTGTTRGAIYKTVFDARRKIRAHLVANGYLQDEPASRSPR